MPHLSQLIYRSQATPLFRRGDLPRFIRDIAQANKRQGLTGLLMFDGEFFLQIIEGRQRQLEAILQVLRHDPRHESIFMLRLDAIKERAFPEWGMSLAPLRERDQPPPGWAHGEDAMHLLELHEDVLQRADDRLRMVIDDFLQGRWRRDAEHGSGAGPMVRTTPARRLAPRSAHPMDIGFAFQPILDTASGELRAVEALIRGLDGQSPAEVLGRYSATDVYRFDLESKAIAIEQFAALEVDCRLALNVLPMTLANMKNSTSFLLESLDRHGLAPERLVLEVTEEEAITKPHVFIANMQALRAAGVRVAIDDFGAGYAGLSLLSEFQPDELKIDRMLVRAIHEHGPRQAIVRAVVDFCQAMGIEVVAEGVEQTQEHQWLRRAGISCFQGYLFSRPLFQGIGEIRWHHGDPRNKASEAAITLTDSHAHPGMI